MGSFWELKMTCAKNIFHPPNFFIPRSWALFEVRGSILTKVFPIFKHLQENNLKEKFQTHNDNFLSNKNHQMWLSGKCVKGTAGSIETQNYEVIIPERRVIFTLKHSSRSKEVRLIWSSQRKYVVSGKVYRNYRLPAPWIWKSIIFRKVWRSCKLWIRARISSIVLSAI